VLPASVERASSARERLCRDSRANPRWKKKVSRRRSVGNVVSPLPNLGTSGRPCTRPRGQPLDWATTSACIVIVLYSGKVDAKERSTHSHVLRAGVDPQIVLDQTHDHLEVVAGTSRIDRNLSRR